MNVRYYASSPLGGLLSMWTILTTLVSWGLAAALVFNLLNGPFVERSCQTECTQILALASLLVAILGVVFRPKAPYNFVIGLCLLSLLGLIGMYLTTYFVGTVFG